MIRPLDQILRDLRKAEQEETAARTRVNRYRAELAELKKLVKQAA